MFNAPPDSRLWGALEQSVKKPTSTSSVREQFAALRPLRTG